MPVTGYDNGDWRGSIRTLSSQTSDFFAKKKAGERLPVHAYFQNKLDHYSPQYLSYNGLVRQWDASPAYWPSLAHQVGAFGPTPIRSFDDIRNGVLIRLSDKVREKDIDLGIAIGEYKETAAFIATAMSKTARSYRMLRRGRLGDAVKTIKGFRRSKGENNIPKEAITMASGAWLSYQLALKPLLGDVHSALELMENSIDTSQRYLNVHSTLREITFAEDELNSYMFSSMACHGKVTFVIDNPFWYTMSQVGVTNPISTAWELVPFSFVVDWFTPVGSVLTSMVPPQGVEFIDGYTYMKLRGHSKQQSDNGPYTDQGWHTIGFSFEKYKDRIPLNTWPKPKFHVPDLSLSIGKVTTGLALLWSVFATEGDIPRGLRK